MGGNIHSVPENKKTIDRECIPFVYYGLDELTEHPPSLTVQGVGKGHFGSERRMQTLFYQRKVRCSPQKSDRYSLMGTKVLTSVLFSSLPLVKEMQESGFDIQLIGFGLMKTYHATNEYCSLKDMCDGFRVLAKFIKYNDGVVVAPGK